VILYTTCTGGWRRSDFSVHVPGATLYGEYLNTLQEEDENCPATEEDVRRMLAPIDAVRSFIHVPYMYTSRGLI
jgi:hypothetical protein